MAQFTLQTYTPMYVYIDSTLQTEVSSITVDQMSNSNIAESIAKGFAGMTLGAPRIECSLKGNVISEDSDNGGVGFDSGGMNASGTSLQSTMLTPLNENENRPVSFVINLSSPAVQTLQFKGFITQITTDSSVNKATEFTLKAVGKFSVFK